MEQDSLKQSIDKMGIYELRQFARQMGVPSPTTKKRNELIDLIQKYSNGSQTLTAQNKKGRPPKNVQSVASYFDVVIPEEFKIKDEMMSNTLVFSNNVSQSKKIAIEGYLSVNENGYFYIDNINPLTKKIKVFVPNKLVENAFVVGDYITGYAITADDKLYGLLDNTNGTLKMPIEANYDDVCEMTGVKINDRISEGDRILLETRQMKEFFTKAEQEQMALSGYEIVYFCINATSETYAYIKLKLGGKKFVTSFDGTYKQIYENCKNMINHVKSLISHGKKVIIYAYDIRQVLTALDLYFASQGSLVVNQHTLEALEIVKQIFALGRCVRGGASASIVASVTDMEDEFIKNNILGGATKVIK